MVVIGMSSSISFDSVLQQFAQEHEAGDSSAVQSAAYMFIDANRECVSECWEKGLGAAVVSHYMESNMTGDARLCRILVVVAEHLIGCTQSLAECAHIDVDEMKDGAYALCK